MAYLLTCDTIAHVHSSKTNVTVNTYMVTEHLNMRQYRNPVAHKIPLRKLNAYIFILKNIVNEKWNLEKSLSNPITNVMLPSSAEVECFQHSLPNIRKFRREFTVKRIVQIFIKLNFPMTLYVLFCRLTDKCRKLVRTFTLFPKMVLTLHGMVSRYWEIP